MVSYNTDLQDWGSTGQKPPSGYKYEDNKPPVDAFDNHAQYNLIKDVKHLISTTNSRIESDSGATAEKPDNPESSHIYYNEEENQLEVWDSSQTSWRALMHRDGGLMESALDMNDFSILSVKEITSVQGEKIWDGNNEEIPIERLSANNVTVSAGAGIDGGGSMTLGNSVSLSLTNDSVTVNAGDGLTGGGSVSLGGSVTVSTDDKTITETRTSDPSSPANGREWIRTDL